MSFNFSDIDIIDCWENIFFKWVLDIVGIVFCYVGFFYILLMFGN